MGLLDSSVLGPAADLDQGMVHKLALADLLKQITSGVPPRDQTYNAEPQSQPSQPNLVAGAAADAGGASVSSAQPATPPSAGPAQMAAGVAGASQAPNPWAAQTIDAPPTMPLSMSGQQPQQPAPAPAMAAPAPAQAQPAPMREPDLMDRIGALSRGYNSGGLLGGIAQAAGARDPLQIEEQNQSYQALIKAGVSPDTARAAVLNPAIMQQVIPTAFPPKSPAFVKTSPGERLLGTQVGADGKLNVADMTPGGAPPTDKTPEGRMQLAPGLGLQPGTPQHQAYVANGKIPDLVPDHRAIGEADASTLASKHLIEDFQQAQQLSPHIYSGVGAESRAYFTSNLPGSHPDADATSSYANLIDTSILPSLKQNFGAKITNKDVGLINDIKASANKAPNVRDEILRRGLARAQEIQAEKQSIAQGLRGGTYYRPGGGPDANSLQPQQGAPTGQPQSIGSFEDALRLPRGTQFMDPEGVLRVRP